MRLDDRRAIVTGGASGIGKATAIALAELGADVVVTDIDEAGRCRASPSRSAGRSRCSTSATRPPGTASSRWSARSTSRSSTPASPRDQGLPPYRWRIPIVVAHRRGLPPHHVDQPRRRRLRHARRPARHDRTWLGRHHRDRLDGRSRPDRHGPDLRADEARRRRPRPIDGPPRSSEPGGPDICVSAICPGFTDTNIIGEAARELIDNLGLEIMPTDQSPAS